MRGEDLVEESVIRFPAAVNKVMTMIDGGLRIWLDLPETAIPQAAMLMEAKREGIPLVFEAKADEPAEAGKKRR